MKIDLNIDINSAVLDIVTQAELKEDLSLVLSCALQGNLKGTAIHPGLTIDWHVTRDEEVSF